MNIYNNNRHDKFQDIQTGDNLFTPPPPETVFNNSISFVFIDYPN